MLFTLLLTQNNAGQLASQIFFFGGIILLVYLFMIRPQQAKQRKTVEFRSSLSVGMSIVTIGGLRGKIHEMDEETVTLLVDKNVKLVFDKYAISPEATQRLQASKEKEEATA